MSGFPARLVDVAQARARFGQKVDRLGFFLTQGDPLADAVAEELKDVPREERERHLSRALKGERPSGQPQSLARLLSAASTLPLWADLERASRGGAAVLRKGLVGSAVLTYRSLIAGYCSPAGNKPLALSGRLKNYAGRRLAETGRFVQHLTQPGGVAPFSRGWASILRVRLMHAQMRRLLLTTTEYRVAEWGVPINQADMSATILLFSQVLVDGLRLVGLPVSREEAEDVLHLWRVVAFLIGVEAELHCATEPEAQTLWALTQATHEKPDADSVALAKAIIELPLAQARTPFERLRASQTVPLAYGLSRFLLGDEVADALEYPKNPWRYAAPALKPLLSTGASVLSQLPLHGELSLAVGQRYWSYEVARRLEGVEAGFQAPEAVRHAG